MFTFNREIDCLKVFLADLNKEHPSINWGGCCVFAGIIGRHLKKLGDVKVRVVQMPFRAGRNSNIDEVREKLSSNSDIMDWYAAGVEFFHVLIEFSHRKKIYYIDSEGIRTSIQATLLEGALTIAEARFLGAKKRGWNPTFKRTEIPIIRKKVNEYFKERSEYIKKNSLTS